MVLGATAGLAGLLAVFGPSEPSEAANQTMVLAGETNRYQQLQFTVQGTSVRGLYPGAVKQIHLKIINPYGFDLTIQKLQGKVETASRRECSPSAENIQIGEFTGRLPFVVPARSRATLSGALPITMPKWATAKCADTRFKIALAGTGAKASR